MNVDWRTTAIAAGAAFLLSVLVGVFGGVAFGTLLIRGLLMAIAFGAGAVGANYLIDRYLPELRESSTAKDSPELGGNVDIVVDEDPLDGELEPSEPIASGADAEASFSTGPDSDDEQFENAESADEDAVGSFEDSSPTETQLSSGISASEQPEENGRTNETGPSNEQKVDSSEESEFRPGVEAPVLSSSQEDEEVEELDEATGRESLPDMNGLSDSFAELPTEAEVHEDESGEAGQSGEDPSVMARAIRTVLKRGEE